MFVQPVLNNHSQQSRLHSNLWIHENTCQTLINSVALSTIFMQPTIKWCDKLHKTFNCISRVYATNTKLQKQKNDVAIKKKKIFKKFLLHNRICNRNLLQLNKWLSHLCNSTCCTQLQCNTTIKNNWILITSIINSIVSMNFPFRKPSNTNLWSRHKRCFL